MTQKAPHAAHGLPLTKEQVAANFEDLHKPLTPLQAMVEADRCIYCYDAPCIHACPTSIDIPTFIHQIRTHNTEGAASTILSQNIMGGTCARACPTEVLCEQACVRNYGDEAPVEIGLLQRYAVDHLMAKGGEHPFVRGKDTGKHIAVVGAGPAGLSCAHRLSMLGHTVTVFEAREKSGGLNEYGLAAYKMVDDFAQREVAFLLDIGGIEIRHSQRLGDNLRLDQLQQDYDAVFLGVGLAKANDLGVEGEQVTGVSDAIDLIEAIRQAENKSAVPVGNEVLVIGGGNTAVDAAIQAKRIGAEQVTLVYRRGEAQMSATDWEVELARKNGVMVRFWAKPLKIQSVQNSEGSDEIESVTFERTKLENGKLVGVGKTFTLIADQVLKAIGQKLDTDTLGGLRFEGGKVALTDGYATGLPGVFAGGDCTGSGEDLTVQAVEDGKQAALAIDNFLSKR